MNHPPGPYGQGFSRGVSGTATRLPARAPAAGGVLVLAAVMAIVAIVCGAVLAAGAVLLLRRRMAGRWLVAGGSGVIVLHSLVVLVVQAGLAARHGYFQGLGMTFTHLTFATVTLALALLPSTVRWIQAGRHAPAPFPPYPPYPG